MIAGLELPTSGKILLDGEDVTMKRARERDIAFVFQLFALYPHMSVRKNIGFPLLAQGTPRSEIKARVEETAKLLRIDHLLLSPDLAKRLKTAGVDKAVRGEPGASDHAPTWVTLR